jgi:cytochrome P450
MFNGLDKTQHNQKRRALGQLLTERFMRIFEPTMILQIDIFPRQLLRSSQKSEIINMTMRCQRLGADVVGHLAFGYPLNA